jgi:hypothetical protein
VKSHYPSLFLQLCPLAVHVVVPRLWDLLWRTEVLDRALGVGMDGLLPYYLDLDLWEES